MQTLEFKYKFRQRKVIARFGKTVSTWWSVAHGDGEVNDVEQAEVEEERWAAWPLESGAMLYVHYSICITNVQCER